MSASSFSRSHCEVGPEHCTKPSMFPLRRDIRWWIASTRYLHHLFPEHFPPNSFLFIGAMIYQCGSRSFSSCCSDERAIFCFLTSITSDALHVVEVANNCCRLRCVSISTSMSRLAIFSLRYLSQVFCNQNSSPSPLEEMAYAEVVCIVWTIIGDMPKQPLLEITHILVIDRRATCASIFRCSEVYAARTGSSMERNSSSTLAWESPSRTVHLELMMSCDTCFTHDLKDSACFDPSPVDVLRIL